MAIEELDVVIKVRWKPAGEPIRQFGDVVSISPLVDARTTAELIETAAHELGRRIKKTMLDELSSRTGRVPEGVTFDE